MDANQQSAKTILNELRTFIPEKNRHDVLESKATHIINSAINLLEEIESNYSEEEAEQLTKRFLSSIKGKDEMRFSRAIKRVKEGIDRDNT